MELILNILAWFYYLLTSPTFWILYLIPSYGLVHYGLTCLKPLVPTCDEHRKRDEKYHAFRRHDLDKINHFVIYLQAPLIFVKFMFGWSNYIYVYIVVALISMTKPKDAPLMGWRQDIA